MEIICKYVFLRILLIIIVMREEGNIFYVDFELLVGLGLVGNIIIDIIVGVVKNIVDGKVFIGSVCKCVLFVMLNFFYKKLVC